MKVVKLEDCISKIKSLDNCGVITRSTNHICEDMRKEVKEFEAEPIPEGATNGNMFMTMFPDAEVVEVKYFDGIVSHYQVNLGKINGNQNIVNFKSDWWNAPHKKNCIPSEYDYLEDMELINPQIHR